jgi:hypothetical protein
VSHYSSDRRRRVFEYGRDKRADSLNTPAAVASIAAGVTRQKFTDNVVRHHASPRRLIACGVRAIMYGERVYRAFGNHHV